MGKNEVSAMVRSSNLKPTNGLLDGIKTTVDDPVLLARRRKQITDASIQVFRKLGYHPATIRDVANQANVSVGLIYQYIGDKEDLLFLSLVEILSDYKKLIPRALEGIFDPLDRLVTAVNVYCRAHDAPEAATVLAYRETASLRRERRDVLKQLELDTNELIAACIRDCVKTGLFDADTDVELFTYQITMFSHAWALKAWNFSRKMTVDQYLSRGLRLMLQGVVTRKGQRQINRLGNFSSETSLSASPTPRSRKKLSSPKSP